MSPLLNSVRLLVTQRARPKRLVQAPGLVTLVPGQQGILEPAEISGQIVGVVELVIVGAEGAFDAAVALVGVDGEVGAGEWRRVIEPLQRPAG